MYFWFSIAIIICVLFFRNLPEITQYFSGFHSLIFIARLTHPLAPYTPINWEELILKDTAGATCSSVRRPNILLIIADDLGSNDLSADLTPNILSIPTNGVNFSVSYSGHATCAPSRAAIMTGKFPTKIGFEFTPLPLALAKLISTNLETSYFHHDVIHQVPPMGHMVVPKNESFISELLSEVGYSNYYFGKWHLGEVNGSTPLDRGFHHSLAIYKGASRYFPPFHPDAVDGHLGTAMDSFLWWNLRSELALDNGREFGPPGYMTDFLSDSAAAAIRAHSLAFPRGPAHKEGGATEGSKSKDFIPKQEEGCQKPFFLTLAYNAIHNPLQATRSDYNHVVKEALEKKEELPHTELVYRAMIRGLDRGVGTVLQALQETGEADNTLVLFTSDNGGPHYLRFPHINFPFRGWKCTLFEGGLRVPLFLTLPKSLRSSLPDLQPSHQKHQNLDLIQTSSSSSSQQQQQQPSTIHFPQPVSHIDLLPTILSAAQVNYSPSLFDGSNLLHFLSLPHTHSTSPPTSPFLLPTPSRPLSIPTFINITTFDSSPPISLPVKFPTDPHSSTSSSSSSPHQYLYWRSSHYKALRKGEWKIQLSAMPDKLWLFHLGSDPTEQFNLAPLALRADPPQPNTSSPSSATPPTESPSSFCLSYSLSPSPLHSDSFSTSSASPSSSSTASHPPEFPHCFLQAKLCEMLTSLHMIDAQQVAPLWPAVLETPIPIDLTLPHTTPYTFSSLLSSLPFFSLSPSSSSSSSSSDSYLLNQEYVYWAN